MGSLTKGSLDCGETITQLFIRSVADLSMSCDVGGRGRRGREGIQERKIKLRCARARAKQEGTTWAWRDIYMSSPSFPLPLSRPAGMYSTYIQYEENGNGKKRLDELD